MEFKNILYQLDQNIATITLNRPEHMNSFNLEMMGEMLHAIDLCARDNRVRVVVLTGTGDVFSAGDDLDMLAITQGRSAQEIAETIENQGYPQFVKKIMSLSKPVIASVNGKCFGAGGEIVLACDYIIASSNASFGQLYINAGLIGNTYLLPRVVGSKKALELIWTGRIISAEEAFQLGMVNSVVVAGALVEKTYKLARKLAQGPALALGLAKRAVYEGINADLHSGIHTMCQFLGQLMISSDHQEAVTAYLQKRKPNFLPN